MHRFIALGIISMGIASCQMNLSPDPSTFFQPSSTSQPTIEDSNYPQQETAPPNPQESIAKDESLEHKNQPMPTPSPTPTPTPPNSARMDKLQEESAGASSSKREVDFSIVHEGNSVFAKNKVIKTREEWKNEWQRLYSNYQPKPQIPLFSIDFKKYNIYIITIDDFGSTGDKVSVISINDNPEGFIIKFEYKPSSQSITSTELIKPFAIVKAKKSEKSTIFININSDSPLPSKRERVDNQISEPSPIDDDSEVHEDPEKGDADLLPDTYGSSSP